MITLSCIVLLSAVTIVSAKAGQEDFIKDPCRPNPCRNGGVCRMVELDQHVIVSSCRCPPSIAGVFCRIRCRPKAWLYKACKTDRDCLVPLKDPLASANADRQPKCFEKKCRCPVGLYYSVGQRFCVKYCRPDERQKSFTSYPHSGINGYNNFVWQPKQNTLEKCKEACFKEPTCKNFETNGEKCNGANVNMVPGISFSLNARGWTHWQINCA